MVPWAMVIEPCPGVPAARETRRRVGSELVTRTPATPLFPFRLVVVCRSFPIVTGPDQLSWPPCTVTVTAPGYQPATVLVRVVRDWTTRVRLMLIPVR